MHFIISLMFTASFLLTEVTTVNTTNGPQNPKHTTLALENRSISCRPNQAISSIKWVDNGQHKLDATIQCINVSDGCNETCRWRERCVSSQYMTGLRPIFSNTTNKYLAGYLCCNNSANVKPSKCQPFKKLEGGHSSSDERSGRSFIRGAKNEGTRYDMYIERCELEKPVNSTCPWADLSLDQHADYTDLKYLGLLGLIGLVAVKAIPTPAPAPAPQPPTASPPFQCPALLPHPYCCGTVAAADCQQLCTGQFVADYPSPCEDQGLGTNPPGSNPTCCNDDS